MGFPWHKHAPQFYHPLPTVLGHWLRTQICVTNPPLRVPGFRAVKQHACATCVRICACVCTPYACVYNKPCVCLGLSVQKKKSDDLAVYPDCLLFSKRIMEGLKSVNVVVGTSIGHTHSMEAVLALFRAAMNYRHDVFTAPHKQEVETWVRTTKVRTAQALLNYTPHTLACDHRDLGIQCGHSTGSQGAQDCVYGKGVRVLTRHSHGHSHIPCPRACVRVSMCHVFHGPLQHR
jgi:hypothetical protein